MTKWPAPSWNDSSKGIIPWPRDVARKMRTSRVGLCGGLAADRFVAFSATYSSAFSKSESEFRSKDLETYIPENKPDL